MNPTMHGYHKYYFLLFQIGSFPVPLVVAGSLEDICIVCYHSAGKHDRRCYIHYTIYPLVGRYLYSLLLLY